MNFSVNPQKKEKLPRHMTTILITIVAELGVPETKSKLFNMVILP